MTKEVENKYYKFIDTFIFLHIKSGLASHFMRRWKPFQMPTNDNQCIETFKFLGVLYRPKEKKWWQFWCKTKEEQFHYAISQIGHIKCSCDLNMKYCKHPDLCESDKL